MVQARGWIFVLLLFAGTVRAQPVEYSAPASIEPAVVDAAMRSLAVRALAAYRDDDRDRYLNRAFRMQTVAGQYDQAEISLKALRELRRTDNQAQSDALFVQYQIYARARAIATTSHVPMAEAFATAFRAIYAKLDDKAAFQAGNSFLANLDRAEGDFNQALAQDQDRPALSLDDAFELLRRYHFLLAYRPVLAQADALVSEDDRRRYAIDDHVLVRTADGAAVEAFVVRPRTAAKLTTLFEFTIYANDLWSLTDAKKSAAYGYAGVVAYTRGKGRSPGPAVPYEHDGADASAVIDWISQQAWSDGRVGMYGGSYNGFAAWAAAKHHPRALKAIMDSATAAPGIDVPMQGNVFLNFIYPWIPYTTNVKGLDDASYNDKARWDRMNRAWYLKGGPYRALDQLDGTPNPIFRRWLDHPGYDDYWQAMVPYREDFADINFPVLTTTGYYDGGMVGALYYLSEHLRFNPRADHTLVIGPYGHLAMQFGVERELQGYALDPAAVIDLPELRYQWFDYVFKGGAKPALLSDRINYEVMGANQWKHASSLATVANGHLRFYLGKRNADGDYRLQQDAPAPTATIEQTVDFADRRDVDAAVPPLLINDTLDRRNALVFASEPMTTDTEFSGLFSGQLDVIVNKRDFDYSIALYERRADGSYFQLSAHLGRASYSHDRNRRKLLDPGHRQLLPFQCERMTSVVLPAGSRLVLVLSINKQPDMQINYGTGKDVSDESIRDASTPLRLRWYGGSYISIPVNTLVDAGENANTAQ